MWQLKKNINIQKNSNNFYVTYNDSYFINF